jgi:hypothetical protein
VALPILAACLALLLVGALTALIVLHRSPSTAAQSPRHTVTTPAPLTTVVTQTVTPPTPHVQSARQQVNAVEALILGSIHDRAAIRRAIVNVEACRDLAASERTIRQVTAHRVLTARRAEALDVSQLPRGPQVRTLLVTVLSDSRRADAARIPWSEHRPCVVDRNQPPTAQSLDSVAEDAKYAFLKVWRPVAREYGVPLPAAPTAVGSF